MRRLVRQLGMFAMFGIATGAAVGLALDQIWVATGVGAVCGIFFGYCAGQ